MKKLYLSDQDKKLFGVCGGIAEYFEVDSTVVRLAWIFASVITVIGPGVIGYLVAAMVMPKQSDAK